MGNGDVLRTGPNSYDDLIPLMNSDGIITADVVDVTEEELKQWSFYYKVIVTSGGLERTRMKLEI